MKVFTQKSGTKPYLLLKFSATEITCASSAKSIFFHRPFIYYLTITSAFKQKICTLCNKRTCLRFSRNSKYAVQSHILTRIFRVAFNISNLFKRSAAAKSENEKGIL